MVVHVFRGDLDFHIKKMILFFQNYSKNDSFFVIVLPDKNLEQSYHDYFKNNQMTNYRLVSPSPDNFIYKLFQKNKKDDIFWGVRMKLIVTLLKYRHDKIIYHGACLLYNHLRTVLMLLGVFPHMAWVCWGEVKLPKNNSIKDKLTNYLNFLVFRKFKKISCLMYPDYRLLSKLYRRSDLVITPYPIEFTDLPPRNREENENLLIGNSAHNIATYIEFFKEHDIVNPNMQVTCMMNYGDIYCSENQKKELTDLLNKKFSGRYEIWDKVVTLTEYNAVLNRHEFYIGNMQVQSGLGAIYFMLALGKTVYLRGRNYLWLKKMGFRINHVREIPINGNSIKKISDEDKGYNIELWKQVFPPERVIKNWDALADAL